MTTKELINKVKDMEFPQHLDENYIGHCPCFRYETNVDGYKVYIHGHCWRTCMDCPSQALHIKSKLPDKDLKAIAKAFKKQLDAQKWYGEYDVVYEK